MLLRMWLLVVISAVVLIGAGLVVLVARKQWNQDIANQERELSISEVDKDAVVVPAWASSLDAARFTHFMALVKADFEARDGHFQFEDGWIIRNVPNRRDPFRYGLTNLSQLCAQSPAEEWTGIINDHFNRIIADAEQVDAETEHLKSFENARSVLYLRLWPEEALAPFKERDESLPARVDLPGTVTTLVYDLPNAIRSVSRRESDHWNLSDGELFDIALSNLRNLSAMPEPKPLEIGEGARLFVMTSDSFLTASAALIVDDYPELFGSFGTLIGVPTRHIVLASPINDITAMRAVNAMIPMIRGMESDGPGSVSPHLYWRHKGQFVQLPYEMTDKKIAFHPPVEFIEMLNALPEQ